MPPGPRRPHSNRSIPGIYKLRADFQSGTLLAWHNYGTVVPNPLVRELRQSLEALGIETWVDSERLSGGDALTPAIQHSIENADQLLRYLQRRRHWCRQSSFC